MLAYLAGKGFDPSSSNMTVSSMGGHPKVKGNGYVPYYMVFDHTGKLVRHHMCGDYHGGDGLEMIDWVEKLLKKAPEIYLGAEPFEVHTKLAARVQTGKGLAKSLGEVESLLQPGVEGEAELRRIVR